MGKLSCIYFWKTKEPFGQFSQWYPTKFYDKGIEYHWTEQYMMYQKALLFNDMETGKQILEAKNPAQIKALGKKVRNFNQKVWDENKYKIVVKGNMLKFTDDFNLGVLLINSGESEIAEASPYDTIWGIGISPEDARKGKDWKGENLLGKALMEVRDKIKDLKQFEIVRKI